MLLTERGDKLPPPTERANMTQEWYARTMEILMAAQDFQTMVDLRIEAKAQGLDISA